MAIKHKFNNEYKKETKMELSKNTKELAATNDTLTAFRSLDEIQTFGDRIAKSGLTPLKEGKDIVAAILFGRELGLQPMVSVNNIYPINGKGTLSVHIINALLQKNGVVVEKIRDYEPCMPFALKGENGKAALFNINGAEVERNSDGSIPLGASPLVLREGFADERPKDHEVRGTKIVNYKTVLRFTRNLKQPDGSYREQIIESSYSTIEAAQAGLSSKDNWMKYPRQMVLNRALAFGGRLIGSDILLGMLETSEMADANNLPYKLVDNEHVKILSNKDNISHDTSSYQTIEEVNESTSKEGQENKSDSN